MMQNLFRVLVALNALLFVFTGCAPEKKKGNDLDGKALLESRCASCHNLDIPPETYPEEKAPPMMAVAFHIYDFIQVSTPAEKIPASIAFVKDYVFNPSIEKSFCDRKSLQDYGLMPSQKGKLSEEELEAVAIYMFDHYNQENFLRVMKERQLLRDMDPGERVARKHGCISCHGITQKKMGPALRAIANRYEDDEKQIRRSILEGTQDRWKEANHARMPSFKTLGEAELDSVTNWILEQK
jgi:cytochrome c551/c552